LQRLLLVAPHREDAHRVLAELYRRLDRGTQAREVARDWLRFDPASPWARDLLWTGASRSD
jgi:hypothetical protein